MRFLCWTTLLYIMTSYNDTSANGRSKRILAFRKGSTFFYRMNYKINSFSYTTIFAQATGFKLVWKLPDGLGFKEHRPIRDIYENAKLMYESHGFNGQACLMKNYCEATEYIEKQDGMIEKILRLLLRSFIENGTMNANPLTCGHYTNQCPLQFIGINDFSQYES